MARLCGAAWLFSLTVLSAGAQSIIKPELGPWTAMLDGTWRWHAVYHVQVHDADSPETRIFLRRNDRIAWTSDAATEARNGKNELLGFDRARELATTSASDIARAAQLFGQEDDIMVVSITRQPVVYVA